MRILAVLLGLIGTAAGLFSQGIGIPNPIRTNSLPIPTLEFSATLSGFYELPPNGSPYRGAGNFSLVGSLLDYAVGLPFPVFAPTSARIYGPAAPGMNGQLILELTNYTVIPPVPNSSFDGGLEYAGSLDLSSEQIEQLKAGLWYVNVGSASFPNGELRGQICPQIPDADCDYDGVANKEDRCPNTAPGRAVDACGCSVEQLVPCSGPWLSHHDYVKAVKEQAFRFWQEGRITPRARNEIIKEAGQADCGNPLPPPIPGGFRPPG